MAINHHRVVADKPQNQIVDYVLAFDAFKDMTFYANVSVTKQHFTISTDNIDEITVENNPDGIFSEEECSNVFHLYMKSGDVISVGIYEI